MALDQPVLPIFTTSMNTIPPQAHYVSGVLTSPNSQNTKNWFSNKYSIIKLIQIDFLVLIHILLFDNLVFYMGEMAQESPPIELEFL